MVQEEEMHLPEPGDWPTIFHTLKVLVPCLGAPSAKAMSEYYQIKEQH